jgi:hypothetical protein
VPGDAEASELIARIVTDDEDDRMPPTDEGLSPDQVKKLRVWIASGAKWPARPVSLEEVANPDLISDAAFLRRVWLDTLGIPPSETETSAFLADGDPDKRLKMIRRLLDDEGCADHFISEWLDLLAENPTLLNQSQGSTGPFRFFLHDSLRDDKPIDRIMSSALTDEIERCCILHRRGFYPGLDRNGVSIGEIEATLPAFVRNNDFRSGPVKAQRFVGFRKTGEFRRTRTFIAQIKTPLRHRRHFVGKGNAGKKRELERESCQ